MKKLPEAPVFDVFRVNDDLKVDSCKKKKTLEYKFN